MNSFAEKVAIVTGGGSGMGRELVRQLAAGGCSVAACDLNADSLDETKELATAEAVPHGLSRLGQAARGQVRTQVLVGSGQERVGSGEARVGGCQARPGHGRGRLVVSPHVRRVSGHAVRYQVWPADPPQLGRDLGVVQVGMVTALAADDLERVAVAAFRTAFHDADRLTAQDHRPAESRLITGHHAPVANPSISAMPTIFTAAGPHGHHPNRVNVIGHVFAG